MQQTAGVDSLFGPKPGEHPYSLKETALITLGTAFGMSVGAYAKGFTGALVGGGTCLLGTQALLNRRRTQAAKQELRLNIPKDTAVSEAAKAPVKSSIELNPAGGWGASITADTPEAALFDTLGLTEQPKSLLGTGATARVKKFSRPDGTEFAVKLIRPWDEMREPEVAKEVSLTLKKGEICGLELGDHPNITKTHALLVQDSRTNEYRLINDLEQISKKDREFFVVQAVVTDLNKGDDLFDALNGNQETGKRKNPDLSHNAGFAVAIAQQICEALIHVHSQGQTYRDLKPENIMYDPMTGVAKLIDFSYNFWGDEQSRYYCGTAEAMAPETAIHKKYDSRVDVWALGILLCELTTGTSPAELQRYGEPHELSLEEKLRTVIDYSKLNDTGKAQTIKNLASRRFHNNRPLLDLIVSLTQTNPDKRPSLEEVRDKLASMRTHPSAAQYKPS